MSAQLPFSDRHIGPRTSEVNFMLKELNLSSLNELTEKTVPKNILSSEHFDLPKPLSEHQLLVRARELSRKNKIFRSMIGQGYYGTMVPPVIQRNLIENPGWYTAYTPYQAEISQGRMESLLNYQTLVTDLTGMTIANASLLDEGTAAAEAMTMCLNAAGAKVEKRFFVADTVFQQTKEVLQTRAEPMGIELIFGNPLEFKFDKKVFGMLLQYPDSTGEIHDYKALTEKAHENDCVVVVATDLLALTLLTPPGEWGADVVLGNSQRFGVPMGFGGPHAAFFATTEDYKRLMPGRIIGVSKDASGKSALRLALQTREQHIRREKATSNICTAQVLLANMAAMYAVYHGPQGLKAIAHDVAFKAQLLAAALKQNGISVVNKNYFDTLTVQLTGRAQEICNEAEKLGLNFFKRNADQISISIDETTSFEDLDLVAKTLQIKTDWTQLKAQVTGEVAQHFQRRSNYLTHPVFNSYHSETEMLRYLFKLQNRDLALNRSMIPLGSCTMKLNATAEMMPVTFTGFSQLHPFAPLSQAKGYLELIKELEGWLSEITGFAAVSLQPNAGSQGEYAGLLVIRQYHISRGQGHRNICLIPSSAHGTNPASAVMAGMKVIVVSCDSQGNVDVADLKKKAEEHRNNLAALMITYPSTHGVFEESIREICDVVHSHGGQVYMDGANMNALVGVCQPGKFGPDVSHMNLHKTFCIPHGGGGPGVGPIGVAKHLAEFLPRHSLVPEAGPSKGISAVSAAPWGSASILPISWAYIAMMGSEGLTRATQVAILNANYMAKKLSQAYPILYKGQNGMVAHECIIDCRAFKDTANITVEDIAKRLMDYGFHAPTMSWPVPGTLMIEPTESESQMELDRFIEAMLKIREEIREIEMGKMDKEDNPLKNAPHTIEDLCQENWTHSYSRERAVFPATYVRDSKYWPPVKRVDNAFGDRNLVCICPSPESYQE